MFKGKTILQDVSANTNIPITVVTNTNNNVSYNSNTNVIEFNTPGLWDVYVTLVGTDFAAGDVSLTEYVNGVASTTALSTNTSAATTDYVSFNIIDVIRVVPSMITEKANVSFQLSVKGTVSSANIIVEGRK